MKLQLRKICCPSFAPNLHAYPAASAHGAGGRQPDLSFNAGKREIFEFPISPDWAVDVFSGEKAKENAQAKKLKITQNQYLPCLKVTNHLIFS